MNKKTFDVTNMLSKVVDKDKGELENFYNGLGFRVASIRPEERIEYLCDLSKDYYNLLERTVNGETESFVYDNNVISMSKAGNNFYYLQDELGSPMYMTGTDGVAVSSYAFDDFGRNIDPFTGKIKENNKHGYTKQDNIIQPFAFTGYQEDAVSGLKFAQARYYSAEKGRFVGEDKVRGFIDKPVTINHYLYCWNSPLELVDRNGLYPAKGAIDPYGDERSYEPYNPYEIRKATGDYIELPKDEPIYSDTDAWKKSFKSDIKSFTRKITATIDGIYTGIKTGVGYVVKSPIFETVYKDGKNMIKVFDSDFYKGGRGGIRYIGEEALEQSETAVGNAFRVSKLFDKVSRKIAILGGIISFVEEIVTSPDEMSVGEKVTNGLVEGAWGVGSTMLIGAGVGSIVPGAGTVAGAIVGFVIGLIAGIVSNIFVHAKILKNHSMSIMDYLKKYANGFREWIVDMFTTNIFNGECVGVD